MSVLAATVMGTLAFATVGAVYAQETQGCPPGQPLGRPPGEPPGDAPRQPPGRPPEYPPGKCQLQLSSSTGAAGTSVTVTGSGYQPTSQVNVALQPGDGGVTAFSTDSRGAFSGDFLIPATTRPGDYTIAAAGVAPGGAPMELAAAFTVTQEGTTPLAAPAAGAGSDTSRGVLGGLARTGSSAALPLLAVAITLVLIGAVTVATTRRRRSPVG